MLTRLTLTQKLSLITLILAMPLGLVMFLYVRQTQELRLNTLTQQSQIMPVLEELTQLGSLVQDHGSSLPLWILDAEDSQRSLHNKTEEINARIKQLDRIMGRQGRENAAEWAKIEGKLRGLFIANDEFRGFSSFSDVSADLLGLARKLNYENRLYSGTERLISLNRLVFDLAPALTDNVSNLRGYITYKVFVGEKSIDDISIISGYLSLARFRFRDIELAVRTIQAHVPEKQEELARHMTEIEAQRVAVEHTIEAYIDKPAGSLDATVFFDTSTRLIEQVEALRGAALTMIQERLQKEIQQNSAIVIYLMVLSALLAIVVLSLIFYLSRSFVAGVKLVEELTGRMALGDRQLIFPDRSSGAEIQAIVSEIHKIYQSICASEDNARQSTQLLETQKQLNDSIRGVDQIRTFARSSLATMAEILRAEVGTFYIREDGQLRLLSNLGLVDPPATIALEEGLIGLSAADGKMRIYGEHQIPEGCSISSSFGDIEPKGLIVLPIRLNGEVLAVLEFLSLHPWNDMALRFVQAVEENTAVLLRSTLSAELIKRLLEESQFKSDKLEASNEELREKTELLNEHQLLLQQINEELEEQRQELKTQNENLEAGLESLAIAKQLAEEKSREAEEASHSKSIFLANISHELRTPLNSIMILSRVLSENREQHLSEIEVKNAATIHSAGKDLLQLINEILDLSKIEAGKLELRPTAFGLSDLAQELEQLYLPLAHKKSLQLAVTVDRTAPPSITSDRQRLGQIIRNFLGNAIKFTEQGRVELSFERSSKEPFALQISVQDSGIGIPPDMLEQIFEPFRQVDNTLARKHEGTGLGLAISRSLAQRLGGHIEVQSEEGRGSRFVIYLPAHIAPPETEKTEVSMPETRPAPAAVKNESTDELSLSGKRILVVDDDIRNVYAFRQIIHGRGAEILVASHGREALDKLADDPCIDLILMDIMMPEMDGYETMRRIRAQPALKDLPIIALTAKAMKNDRELCIEAGASDYLVKPIDTEKLLDLLRIWLSH